MELIPPIFEKKIFIFMYQKEQHPKDGPSAGIAMVTSIVSSITNIPINREIAMTGEVTITGQVLSNWWFKRKITCCSQSGN